MIIPWLRSLAVLLVFSTAVAQENKPDGSSAVSARPPWNATFTDTLKRSLLAGYDKFARPSHHSVPTNVTFGMTIYHVQLDDFTGVMAIHGWVALEWNDDKLRWNSAEYGGLKELHVGDHEIWQPDVIQYNSAFGSSVDQYGNTHCLVDAAGTVLWVPPTKLTTFCNLDLRKWPLDEQDCTFVFGSWTYDGSQIDLKNRHINNDSSVINEDYLVENAEWELLNVTSFHGSQVYPCCPNAAYAHVQYNVHVRRRGHARAALLRAQAAAAVVLSLLAHWLPPAVTPRALLAAAPPALLAVALFYMADHLPSTEHTPNLVILYSLFLYLTCTSAVISVVVLNVSRSRRALPWALRRALASPIGRLLSGSSRLDSSGTEELQEREGGAAEEPLSALQPPPARAWLALATALDRSAFILFLCIFSLLFFIYGF